MLENIATLFMLIFLQAVLGFDNLLYISIESKKVAEEKQQYVRRLGIGLAIVLRIILLFVVMKAIELFQNPIFDLHWEGIIECDFNVHALIVLVGGVFIIYTAVKEITHMLALDKIDGVDEGSKKSLQSAIMWIVVMNLVFSFDSILSALALTDVFWVMATAILFSGVLMMVLSDRVSDFLQKNRMYEVLGLFILFIVGAMLASEGGHLAHLKIFDFPIEPMAKSTFYFVIFILVIVDVVQGRYQKKIELERNLEKVKS